MRAVLLVLAVLVAAAHLHPRARRLPGPGALSGRGRASGGDAVRGGDRGTGRGARPGARRGPVAGPADPRRRPGPAPDSVTILDLLVVAVEAGASVPDAVGAVGDVLVDPVGADLRAAAGALRLGTPWAAAWARAPGIGEALAPLESAWSTGAGAAPALRAAAAGLRRERERAAREAAARLGVRIVLPLGLCFLPAFVLIGLVPVLVSLAGTLLR